MLFNSFHISKLSKRDEEKIKKPTCSHVGRNLGCKVSKPVIVETGQLAPRLDRIRQERADDMDHKGKIQRADPNVPEFFGRSMLELQALLLDPTTDAPGDNEQLSNRADREVFHGNLLDEWK